MCKMKRSVILKTDAKQTLIWLHDWFYRESPVTGDFISGEFNVKAKDLADYMFDEIPRKNLPTNMTDQDLRNRLESFFQENLNTTVKGRLSDLFTNEKETTLIIYAQYRAEISGKAVANSYIRIPVLTIKCYGVGQLQTQVIAIDCSPDVIHILDALWQEIRSTFELRDEPAEGVTKVIPAQLGSGEVWKPWENMQGATEQEIELIRLFCTTDLTEEEIAKELFITEGALANYISNLRRHKFPNARIPSGARERAKYLREWMIYSPQIKTD